jgi:hypothetical protein
MQGNRLQLPCDYYGELNGDEAVSRSEFLE